MKNSKKSFFNKCEYKLYRYTQKNILCIITTFVSIFFAVSALFSCGIKDVTLLNAANVSWLSPSVFSINHNAANTGDSFVGYNVYYKLYDTASQSQTIYDDSSYITDSTRAPSPSVITSRGFRKILPVVFNGISFGNDDNDDVLLKPVDKQANITYYLDFSASKQEHSGKGDLADDEFIAATGSENLGYQALLIDGNTTRFIHRRQNADVSKSFFDTNSTRSFDPTDSDITSMVGTTFSDEDLSIVIAVIPYGIDFEAVQRVYGDISVSSAATFDYTLKP